MTKKKQEPKKVDFEKFKKPSISDISISSSSSDSSEKKRTKLVGEIFKTIDSIQTSLRKVTKEVPKEKLRFKK